MTLNHQTYQAIAGDTIAQLSATAAAWPVMVDIRTTEPGNSRGAGVGQAHLACVACGQSVITLAPQIPGAYQLTLLQLAPAVLRHVRERHCDGGGVLLDM